MKLVDCHCHLNEFDSIEDILKRARKNDVAKIIAVSMDIESCLKNLELGQTHRDIVVPALGVHPLEVANTTTMDIDEIFKLIRENKAAVIGEVGLHFLKISDKTIIEKQREIFEKFLELAQELELPVIVHSKNAENETIRMLEKYNLKKVLLHWYQGSIELAHKALDLGYYFSTTPAILYSKKLQKIFSELPLSRILVESDGPVVYIGQTGEPFLVKSIIEKLALIRSEAIIKIGKETTKNAEMLFNLKI